VVITEASALTCLTRIPVSIPNATVLRLRQAPKTEREIVKMKPIPKDRAGHG